MGSLPLITRIFSPENFGYYAFFVTIVSVLGMFTTGFYQSVIMITDSDRERRGIMFLILILSLVVGLFFTGSIFFLGQISWAPANIKLLGSHPVVLLFSLILYGWCQTLYPWVNRQGYFTFMGAANVLRDSVLALGKLGFGYLGVLKFGLVYGYLGSQLVFFAMLLGPVVRNVRSELNASEITLDKLYALAKKYVRFPKIFLATNFLQAFSLQAPIIFFGMLFGWKILGFYALARSVAGLPIAILAGAIAAVFQREASQQYNKSGDCSVLFLKTGSTIFLSLIFPCLVAIAYTEPLFALAFGDQWVVAGTYCAILGPLYLIRLIGKPLSFVFQLTDHLELDFSLTLIFLMSSCLSLGIGYVFASAELSVYLISISHSFSYLVYIYFGYQISQGKQYSKIGKYIGKQLR